MKRREFNLKDSKVAVVRDNDGDLFVIRDKIFRYPIYFVSIDYVVKRIEIAEKKQERFSDVLRELIIDDYEAYREYRAEEMYERYCEENL